MEGKSDTGGQSHGFKTIESLKKILLPEDREKAENYEEACLLFGDLIKSISSSLHKPNSSQVISQAIEVLFLGCSNSNHRVRSSASENLRKLVKERMGTHFARIQQDLFHEIKKNGESRSLCIALESFSSLFPHTRPSKCSVYAQNLVPVILRLISREEESLHDALQDAFVKILPRLAPFVSLQNIKAIGNGLMSRLKSGTASYRRMASSTLANLVRFSSNSSLLAQWLLNGLFGISCRRNASSEMINGTLMTLQQLFVHMEIPFALSKQAYCYIVSCLKYQGINTMVSSLECLQQLLKCTDSEFMLWLTLPLTNSHVATEFWRYNSESDDQSDTAPLQEDLDTPLDDYFETDQSSDAPAEPSTDSQSTPTLVSDTCCMFFMSDNKEPLTNLVEFMLKDILSAERVSAQSLGLTCITAAVDISPNILNSLDQILPFMESQDPKLRGSTSKLLATVILSQLRFHHGDFVKCGSMVSTAYDCLVEFINDETPIVLKSVCEAMRVCLPLLLSSSQPTRVVDIVHRLLPLGESSYWLTKVELLQTLSCLDYTILHLYDKTLPEKILNHMVFKLVGDSDYRVRSMACHCLASLGSSLSLNENPLLAHAQVKSSELFHHLHSTSIGFSFAGISDTLTKEPISPPIGLKYILWLILGSLSSSANLNLQLGCLEALHLLSVRYPPASVPAEWDCVQPPFSLIEVLSELLKSSRLAWGVQAHSELLDVSGSIFLSCWMTNAQHDRTATGSVWGGLEDHSLIQFASDFLSHTVKILSIFVHIIEERDPEIKDKKIQIGVSPKKQGNMDLTSPTKAQVLQESLNIKPPLVPKDGLGYFANLPHYVKLFDACKAAYTNFQVSLDPIGSDKFSHLLQICHKCLSILFEVAFTTDVGKYVEEILFYVGFTVKIDPSGALLCVQQLLNALFGMNTAAQHTHLYSPFMSSLNFTILNQQNVEDDSGLYAIGVSNPITLMKRWLVASASTSTPPSADRSPEKRSLAPLKKALVMKPVNSASDIKDYIAYFEPLVVYALNQFPYTSSLLLQQRVLFLIVQLMHLKVRYDLLDCNHSFFESVKKLLGLMETGMVKGGEALIPHLFQFLVLLASDQSKLVTIPEVIQRCDGVMASGHNVTTFAIPALQPLVLNLFVRSTRSSSNIDIQREVALSMLLRLIEHSRVTVLLTHVLDSCKRKKPQWLEVSNKIYAALLPRIGKLQVVLDSNESLLALYQLLMTMSPQTINIQSLLAALLKQSTVTSPAALLRWLSVVSLLLQLMESRFPTSCLSTISSLVLEVPEFKCPFVAVPKVPKLVADDSLLDFAWFLRNILLLGVRTLSQAITRKCTKEFVLLPSLIAKIVVLLQIVLSGRYQNLKEKFSSLPADNELCQSFLEISNFFPLLTLHYLNLVLLVKPNSTDLVESIMSNSSRSSSSILLQHGTILSVCSKYNNSMKPLLLTIAKSPAILLYPQSDSTSHFLRCVYYDKEAVVYLFDQLKLTGLESPNLLQQFLCVASKAVSPKTVKFLCSELISHPLPVIGQAAANVATNLLHEGDLVLSAELAEELLQDIKSYKARYPELASKLHSLCGKISPLSTPESFGANEDYNKEFFVKVVAKLSESAACTQDIEVCTSMLLLLEVDDMQSVFDEADMSMPLLENCIVRGTFLSLNLQNTLSYSESMDQERPTSFSGGIHPILESSMKHLLKKLKEDTISSDYTRCFVRLFAASHQFAKEFELDPETIAALRNFCIESLECHSEKSSPLNVQNSLDCCTLALHLPIVREGITAEWAKRAVGCLYRLMKHVYPIKLPKLDDESCEDSDLKHTKDQLLGILSVLLNRQLVPSPYTIHKALKSFTFTLCRLSIWHGLVITPPVLKGEGTISYKILDEALMESEVLIEYMQRCNSLGWLTRFQFEERWMQLLGVLNQPMPSDHSRPEEYQAYFVNVCAGMQAITSLLLNTTLRPHMGDPTSSVPMTIHRNNEMLFLGSRPGRKLATVRKRVELEILQECGGRSDIYSYYQCPLLNHYSSSLYPPLYTRNIEKEVSETSIGYAQISVSSLWSIIFKQTSAGYHSASEEIDVKSCVLSLIDLYNHWLNQPLHIVVINHIFQSIVMLSDLFTVSSQFKWMLQLFLDYYDSHPQEDLQTMSLITVGILKAVAILKCDVADLDKVVKIVEKALGSDFIIQTACIRGLLYLSEDTSSLLMPNCIPFIMKYAVSCFQEFLGYTEEHLEILWSLVIRIITDFSQHIKDHDFTARILELITHIKADLISSGFFYSLTLGLEFLVLNFALSPRERLSVINLASTRFVRSDHSKSLIALSLLLSCMYTGEEADVASGLVEPSSNPMETAIQAREQVNNLMERLRHGPEVCINFIVDILPQIITDFLPPMEVLQTVVTDFISPHQSRPQLSATIMAQTFGLMLKNGHQGVVSEWIMLSLDSFVQQEPESKAVWSLTCTLLAASTNDIYRSLFFYVCYYKELTDFQTLQLLCVAAKDFYTNQCDEDKQSVIVEKFRRSNYSSLSQISSYF